MYRVATYYSLKGIIKRVNLSDFVYGEWIKYNNDKPEYYINLFNEDSISNIIIKGLIDNQKETINSILNRINIQRGLNLSLGFTPSMKIKKNSELVNLELKTLPGSFIKDIY